MLFSSRDLINELQREKERTARVQRALMDEVHDLIQRGEAADEAILQRMQQAAGNRQYEIYSYDRRNVFSQEVIRTISIQYRLRFLPSGYFRPGIPYEAFLKIRELEQRNQVSLREFYVMAPAEAFKLEKKSDPLLFLALGDGKFLLIHRWGSDLSRFRKMISLPLQSLQTLVISILIGSLLIAASVPESWIASNEHQARISYSIRMYVFFVSVLFSMVATVFLHIRRNKNLSEDEWDSPHI